MDEIKELRKKIEFARLAVENEDEPYKSEAFKVILAKQLETSSGKKISFNAEPSNISVIEKKSKTNIFDISQERAKFAKNCGLSVNELNDIFEIQNNEIQLLPTIKGSDAEQQISATKCILTAFQLLIGEEWMESSKIIKSLDSSGISTNHLTRNLRKFASNKIRVKGKGRGKTIEYKITGPGRLDSFEIIKKLGKGVE